MTENRFETMKEILPSQWPARRISIVLTIVALILWSYSITQAKLNIGAYGLISSFPIAFFAALGILTIASAILWVSRKSQSKLLFLQLCLLVISIWLLPVLVGGVPPVATDSYSDMGTANYIAGAGQGHFDARVLWPHSWPAGWVWWSALIQLSGISRAAFEGIIPFVPFIWQCLMLLVIFVFLRHIVDKERTNLCWAGMWLYCLGDWTSTLNTGSQAFGVFFTFSALAFFMMSLVWKPDLLPFRYRVIAIILLAVSAIAHPLFSLTTFAVVAVLYVIRRGGYAKLVAIAAVFIGGWWLTGAAPFWATRLPLAGNLIFNISEATESGLAEPMSSGSAAHQQVVILRLVFSAIILAIAILGGILSRKLEVERRNDSTILAIAVGFGCVAVLVGGGYGPHLYQRFYYVMLPFMVYFGVTLLYWRGTAVLLCLILIVALPLSYICQYGNQISDHLSKGYISGINFVDDTIYRGTRGFITGKDPLGQISCDCQYNRSILFEDLEWESGNLSYRGRSYEPWSHYISISNHDRAYYANIYNKPELLSEIQMYLESARNCNLVFANPDMILFLHEK
jgi:hypothetical protein